MSELTDNELEKKQWEIIKNYLKSSDKIQQYYYALWSNYDGNQKALDWLICNQDTEIATILAIYYNLEPSYYSKYKSLDEVADFELTHYHFIMRIEENIKNRFYKNSTIYFSPSEWVEDFDNEAPRPIPQFMRQEVKGEIVIPDDEPEGYEEGLTHSVYSKIWDLF